MFACDFSLCLVLFRLLANLAVKKRKTWIKWTKQKARPRKPEPFHHDLSYQQQGMCLAAPEEKKKKEKSNEAKAWTQNNCCCWQRDCRSWRDPRPSPTADPTPTIMTLWGDLAPHQNWQLFEECDFLPKTGPVLPVISARLLDGVNTRSASQGTGQVHANLLVFPHFYSFMSCFEIALLFDDSSRSGLFFFVLVQTDRGLESSFCGEEEELKVWLDIMFLALAWIPAEWSPAWSTSVREPGCSWRILSNNLSVRLVAQRETNSLWFQYVPCVCHIDKWCVRQNAMFCCVLFSYIPRMNWALTCSESTSSVYD